MYTVVHILQNTKYCCISQSFDCFHIIMSPLLYTEVGTCWFPLYTAVGTCWFPLYTEVVTCLFTSFCSVCLLRSFLYLSGLCPAFSIVQAEAAHTRRWPNAGLMLVNRLRRWGLYSRRAVSTTRPACYWTQPSKHEALNQCWLMLGQHGRQLASIGTTSGQRLVCWECWQTTLCFAHRHGSKTE